MSIDEPRSADDGETTPPAVAPARGAFVQSLQRGISVLDAVAASPVPLTCKEIAERLNLDRTITHRILRTLEAERMVESELGRYQLSARTLLFGNAFLDHQNLRRVALPHMLSLMHHGLSGQKLATMSLFVPVDAFVTVVEQIWPPDTPLDIILRVNSRIPIDESAAGRCLLAYMSPADVVRLIGVDRAAALEDRLAQIRADKAVDFAQNDRAGVSVFSALIRDRAGRSIGALSVSGRGLESHLSGTSEIALQLRQTAEQIGMAFR